MTKTTIGTIVVVLLVIAGWWFMGGRAVAPTVTEITVQPETVTISGSEFKYEPATISAKVGQTVTVTYTNAGKYPHNLVIDELSFTSKTIKAGETETFSFVPDKVGTFSFYCSLPNHREKGMVGTISVN
ncbi:MAG: cupredoxin domain-containing protein [Candidatus Parcubacteria bacterium]|nr:cupredoxin domain-containing protein [Candidatus Parcubacteria bacterium]